MTDETGLKPCPFCGGDELEILDSPCVFCGICGADGPIGETEDDAIKCWNNSAAEADKLRAERDAACLQSFRQEPPGVGQPARQRAFGDAELPRGFLAAVAFQLAQDHGEPVLGGEAFDFFVEDGVRVAVGFRRRR